MAKELPYFKFFVSEWSDGDITLEELDTQGLFVNLCSYYWSNECELTLTKAKKKFKSCREDCFNELIESNIIKVSNDFIVINFLDEQREERLETSKIRSKGGKASAEARRLKKEQESNKDLTSVEHVLNPSSTQDQLLREEERRKEEKKEDKPKSFNLKNALLEQSSNKELINDWLEVRKNKKASNTQTAFNGFIKEVKKSGLSLDEVLNECVVNSWAGFKSEWIKKESKDLSINQSESKVVFNSPLI